MLGPWKARPTVCPTMAAWQFCCDSVRVSSVTPPVLPAKVQRKSLCPCSCFTLDLLIHGMRNSPQTQSVRICFLYIFSFPTPIISVFPANMTPHELRLCGQVRRSIRIRTSVSLNKGRAAGHDMSFAPRRAVSAHAPDIQDSVGGRLASRNTTSTSSTCECLLAWINQKVVVSRPSAGLHTCSRMNTVGPEVLTGILSRCLVGKCDPTCKPQTHSIHCLRHHLGKPSHSIGGQRAI